MSARMVPAMKEWIPNDEELEKAMKRAAEKFNYSLYGIGGLTTDWQGRFAALVVR